MQYWRLQEWNLLYIVSKKSFWSSTWNKYVHSNFLSTSKQNYFSVKNVHLKEDPVLDHVHQDLEFVVLVRKYYWFLLKIKIFCRFKIILLLFTVTVGCGATINENCTYFEATGLGSGECRTMLCPCSNNICQVNNKV